VEYFLDQHTDEFKTQTYFEPGDIVLDPFCGSGTTLVQANELGINAIGIDVSEFNSLLSNIKIRQHNVLLIQQELNRLSLEVKSLINRNSWSAFETALLEQLNVYNNRYFPAPEFRYRFRNGNGVDNNFLKAREEEFQPIFDQLVKDYGIDYQINSNSSSFFERWLVPTIRNELNFLLEHANSIKDNDVREVAKLVISRTVRSCRATTHSDLATLIEPKTRPYYCTKHYKICKPIFSLLGWFERYSSDTISRLIEFDGLRTDTKQVCLTGDSRTIDIPHDMKSLDSNFQGLVQIKGIKGIFTSPPYVGLIDYHDQHAYSYEIFNFQRRDDFEIGSMNRGTGLTARQEYVQGISSTLENCRRFLVNDFNILIVANDKFNLYPTIVEKAGMRIVKTFHRPVLNRTEKDKAAYSEKIFHIKA
jgi:hypothetical protein